MKRLILLLSFTTPLWSFAQSATILPNNLGVPKVSALPACNTTGKGNQVLNTSDNKMYYCNGTNWQEMTGGGFTLPYNGTVSSSEPLIYLENTGSGRAIYAKSTSSATGIRAESVSGYGLYGISSSSIGVYGISTSGIGVYASSSSNYGIYATSNSTHGGYFEAYGDEPTLYVYSYEGNAANFRGDVKISNELVVDDGKGIVRSNSATQQKVVRLSGNYSLTNLAVGSFADGSLNYENFGGVPTIAVGQVSGGTGDWHKISVVPFNVTATSCQIRFINLSNASIDMTGTWHFLVVGPE